MAFFLPPELAEYHPLSVVQEPKVTNAIVELKDFILEDYTVGELQADIGRE